jgi:predicted dehydrogenase
VIAREHPRKPRLGFIGVGWIGRQRMEAIAQSGAAEVACIADVSPEVARAAGQPYPACKQAASVDELLDSGVDAVVIATPSALHAEQAVRALEGGLPVFCQKPLGRTAAECRRVVDAARAHDRLLAVDFSYRFTTGMRRIRERVASGQLGRVYAVNLVFHNAYGPDKPWFYDPALAGGGCVMDLGIHLVDLALWVLGFPHVEQVESHLFVQGRPLLRAGEACEDYASAQLRLEGGTIVQLACSWKLPAGQDAVIEASFYGDAGGASFRNVNGSFYDFVAEQYRGTSREVLTSPPEAWGGRAAIEFAQRLTRDASFDRSVESLVSVAETLDRIYSPQLRRWKR